MEPIRIYQTVSGGNPVNKRKARDADDEGAEIGNLLSEDGSGDEDAEVKAGSGRKPCAKP